MKVIDAHAHIYERLTGFGPKGEARAIGGGMVEWATGQREQMLRPEHGDTGFSPEKLIELMDEGGIEHAILLHGSNYGFQNSYTAEAVARYPDRLTGSGTFDPYCAKADAIFTNLTENYGFKNLKFEISQGYGLTGYHPDLDINGKLFDRYFSMCEERDITVTVDTGTWGTDSFQIDGIMDMLSRHKDLTFVVAHSLFPTVSDNHNEERLEYIKKLSGENVYFDVANLHLAKDTQYAYMRQVMDIVGADHMTWGTDCPWVFLLWSYAELVDFVCNSGYFSETELNHLMHDTAARIYQK